MPTCMLNRASGSLTAVVIQEETCWGQVAVDHIPQGMEIVTETLANQINPIESQLIRGDRMDSEPDQGNQRPGGDINGEAQPNGPWPILIKHCLGHEDADGNSTVTTTGSGPYTHTLRGSVRLPDGLTIDKRFQYADGSANWLRYLGSRVNEIEATGNNEGIVTMRAGILSRQEVDLAESGEDPLDTSPTYAENNKAFNSFNCAIKLNGAALATAKTFTLRVSNNMDGEQFALDGTPYRADIPADRRTVSGEMTLMFTDETWALYQATRNNDTFSIEVTMTRGSMQWKVTLPSVKLNVTTPQVSGRGPLDASATFKAFRDDDEGTDIIWQIINNNARLSTAA